jgi:hypothetical protein
MIHARPAVPSMKHRSIETVYDLGFSFFSFHKADRPTPETLTTLNRTPGISPLALPLRPKPARRTSSFSSTKLRQPSLGTVIEVISHEVISTSIAIVLHLTAANSIVCPSQKLFINAPAPGKPTESRNLLSVLNELNSDTLSDSGVGLFGFNTDLFEDYALGVGGSSEGRGLEGGPEESLLEGLIGPTLVLAVVSKLAGGVEPSWLSFTHDCCENILLADGSYSRAALRRREMKASWRLLQIQRCWLWPDTLNPISRNSGDKK